MSTKKDKKTIQQLRAENIDLENTIRRLQNDKVSLEAIVAARAEQMEKSRKELEELKQYFQRGMDQQVMPLNAAIAEAERWKAQAIKDQLDAVQFREALCAEVVMKHRILEREAALESALAKCQDGKAAVTRGPMFAEAQRRERDGK